MAVQPWMLVLIVAMPFIGTGFVILLNNRPDAREAASLASAVLTFLFCILALPSAFAAQAISTPSLQILPGLSLQFAADALGLLFACLASLLWIITTVYSIGYMRGLREHAQTRYYASFAITIGSVMGIALSSNLFSMFVFYEILAIAAWPLVVHTETREALAAGRKYLFYTQAGGVAIVAGMMILLAMGNTLDFVARWQSRYRSNIPRLCPACLSPPPGGFCRQGSACPGSRVAAQCHDRPDTRQWAPACRCRCEHRCFRALPRYAVPVRARLDGGAGASEHRHCSSSHHDYRRLSPCAAAG